jgi:ParB-like chromosome segregation protein Spo0J
MGEENQLGKQGNKKGESMKVKISELRPNPFRNIEHYPIDAEKVKTLVASIGQTGFWDNILARKEDGQIQIAYGHHRLAALKQAMKPSDAVDIPVKPLDDATMLKIMANENMDEWKLGPGVIDETVRATKRFLEEHPEELKKLGQAKSSARNEDFVVGAPLIARFLNWPEGRISDSLRLMASIDEGIVDRDSAYSLPHQKAARRFVSAVKEFHLTKSQQKRAVAKINDTDDFSEQGIRDAVVDQVLPKIEKAETKLQDFSEVIERIAELISQLSGELDTLIKYKAEFNSPIYRKTFERFSFEANKSRLLKKFQALDKEISNEKLALPKH